MDIVDYAGRSPIGAAEITRLEQLGGEVTRPSDDEREALGQRFGGLPELVIALPDGSVWIAYHDDNDDEPQVFEAIAR